MNDNPYDPPESQLDKEQPNKQAMENIFRIIIASSTILFIILCFLPYFDYFWLSDEELQILSYDGWGSELPNNLFFIWGLFLTWISISIGLFFFVPIARTAFLILLVFSVILTFFWGIRIHTPLSVLLSGIISMSDGAILIMLYFTSVSSKFSKWIN